MNRILLAATAAAFATLATFGVSHAATLSVETNDLDLSTAKGQSQLDARINRAVRAVCADTITGSRIGQLDAQCVAEARKSIEKQVAARRVAPRNGG